VTVTGLSFAYGGDKDLLSNVNFEIQSGEAVALMGPSGSGKSTLLHLLGGLATPGSGQVRWGNESPDYRRAREVAWIFQTVNVFRRRSALDNVAIGLYAQGLRWHECIERSSDIFEAVGLSYCRDRLVDDLSGGELQRVVVARALVGAPLLVLADEPTGQLDATTSLAVIEALLRARPNNSTVIVATHDSDVAGACGRILQLENGSVHGTSV